MNRQFYSGVLLTAALFAAQPALSQNTVPNPLRGQPAQQRQPEQPKVEAQLAKPEEKAAPAATKPPRERSAKQRQNDDDMRACGASWRAEKDSLKAKGTTWRAYLKDCRAAKKAVRERV